MCHFFIVISGTPSNPEAQPPPSRTNTAATKTPDRGGRDVPFASKWCKVVQIDANGAKWCKVVQKVQNDARWCKVVQMVQNGANWCKVV